MANEIQIKIANAGLEKYYELTDPEIHDDEIILDVNGAQFQPQTFTWRTKYDNILVKAMEIPTADEFTFPISHETFAKWFQQFQNFLGKEEILFISKFI